MDLWFKMARKGIMTRMGTTTRIGMTTKMEMTMRMGMTMRIAIVFGSRDLWLLQLPEIVDLDPVSMISVCGVDLVLDVVMACEVGLV